jgi:hypothetical protein
MIGTGSPNKPNHLGLNSLMCQSSIVLGGRTHCVFICVTRFLGGEVGISKSCNGNGNNVKKSAVGIVSERYWEEPTYARSQ